MGTHDGREGARPDPERSGAYPVGSEPAPLREDPEEPPALSRAMFDAADWLTVRSLAGEDPLRGVESSDPLAPGGAPDRSGDPAPRENARPGYSPGELALLTDLYQLTMLQAYWRERMDGRAVFSLYVRTLPRERNYLLACGLADALEALEDLRFDDDALDFLRTVGPFREDFLEWLAAFRFQGDVHAVPEGTPVFAGEPLLEVEAEIAQAQLVETLVMNQVHLQTVLASKAARVVQAAAGRGVVDFGLRRMHGMDAGLKAARAAYVAGAAATSNVLAGRTYGIPVSGTMAHSYVQAHDDELAAFRAFAGLYPGTTLLVDTYDTIEGVRGVVRLARELGDRFDVGAIRLDSGDLGELARGARRILDEGGLKGVRIFASGGLDEHQVARLLEGGAPIDAFGVGTRMGVSSDAPVLEIAYKLTEYGGEGRLKLSPGKEILPGRKQVFRLEEEGRATGDVIGRVDERGPGRPLLVTVMKEGRRTDEGRDDLHAARRRARHELARLPPRVLALQPADPPYPVEVSEELMRYAGAVRREVSGGSSGGSGGSGGQAG